MRRREQVLNDIVNGARPGISGGSVGAAVPVRPALVASLTAPGNSSTLCESGRSE